MLKRWAWRAVVLAAVLGGLGCAAPLLFVGVTCWRPGARAAEPPAEAQRAAAGVPGYRREGAATFLTLPEWYIVYSTEEYAAFVATRPPSRFPWRASIGQYWRIYAAACHATRNEAAFDPGVHLRLAVIGVSFSGEQAAKGAYELTLGRLAEWAGGHATEEDVFARRTAEEYGRFMHTVPWYEFPFAAKLRGLWRETPRWGAHPARKWERRLVLSAEYGTKAVYGRLIRHATGAGYAPEDARLHAWMEDVPDDAFADTRVRKVRALGSRAWIVALPRSEAFTGVALGLVRRGARFRDIAGNDTIVLTALGPRDTRRVMPPAAIVFDERVLTNPVHTRIAVRAPVRSLGEVVASLERRGASIEHLYDY